MSIMIDFEFLLTRANSYSRLDMLLDSFHALEEKDWVHCFLYNWQSCDTKYDTNFKSVKNIQ